jgi:DNA-binding XRE family transcriptional regulator
MTIGQLLRQARVDAGLSQKDAAAKAKLSAPTLCNIEQSDDCYWSTVVKLCKVYGVSVSDLTSAPPAES